MQSADIRLVYVAPSKPLLGFENDTLQYNKQERDTSYDVDMESTGELNLNALDNLTLSPNLDQVYDEDDEDYESFVSQKQDEVQLPSATADAMETYTNITENIYCGSATGKSIAEESMPCECKYRPDIDNPDAACGDDNYCINRMMFMECMVDDCPCDRYCRNRRFQLKQYARVDVIRTEKKGFGLRALTDLPANAFIMEYIGEVIPNHEFIRRTKEYEAAGLQHYYFMTLKTDEIIDATKKGCLARFINHSCNPNCVTQKWVVGKNMRIGIFTKRPIQAGSELTFDYKFERYGAVAQPCYCGEPSCKGYIGGTLKSTAKPSTQTASEDEEQDTQKEDSDTAAVTLTQKKMLRKIHQRRASEPLQDPREVQSFVKRMLDSVGKSHFVLQLLQRLELTDANTPEGKEILKKFVRLHGLKMLKFWLGEWKNDNVILLKVLQVLSQLPLANRNGLEDCNLLELVDRLTHHENQDIQHHATQLLKDWSQLKSVYRIPKRIPTESTPSHHKHDHGNHETSSQASAEMMPRYESSREFFDPDDDYFEYLSLDVTATEIQWKTEYPPCSTIPTAPRAMMDACLKNGYYGYHRPAALRPSYRNSHHEDTHSGADDDRSVYSSPYHKTTPKPTDTSSGNASPKLPNNWRYAYAEDGTIYYYNRLTGKTQWQFPEERVSSIEGVNQSDLEDLVEKAIQDTENKRKMRSESPAVSLNDMQSPNKATPSISRRESAEQALDENELKKEIGKIVTKYLSSKQKQLWNGDKHLFKELARKMTHHIVDREIQSSRKIQAINSNIRTKIEKFIDTHGADILVKVQRKRKQRSISKEKPIVEENKQSSFIADELPSSPKKPRIESEEDHQSTSPSSLPPPPTDTNKQKDDSYYARTTNNMDSRPTSPYREYNSRPNYNRSHHYTNNGYYRYPHHHFHHRHHHRHRPPSPYYRSSNRYSSNSRRSPPPPPSLLHYYHSRSSSRRGSLSDDDIDRRRWG
ncbi:uncharacterized protein B0P05DRAFT_533685 [Gilbertella persicaria]|uniref:uncharacterized protein n=1 Tax=Gilbertella persicaria TaxID=101096 RepID=UPI00221E471B|nr:uncharacterized protein B0P05DRAFT_533685 [Gilbertella persicaria]KAI8085783.1 hypothetical protein B0P05DRAFT_533685 [Gilbertella persicaria]